VLRVTRTFIVASFWVDVASAIRRISLLTGFDS
jgi:hypothetical protein